MNKFGLGIALGVAAGYVVARMQEKGMLEEWSDNMNEFASQAKKKVKNVIDKGENELEYAKDRVKHKANQAEDKLHEFHP